MTDRKLTDSELKTAYVNHFRRKGEELLEKSKGSVSNYLLTDPRIGPMKVEDCKVFFGSMEITQALAEELFGNDHVACSLLGVYLTLATAILLKDGPQGFTDFVEDAMEAYAKRIVGKDKYEKMLADATMSELFQKGRTQ